MIRSLGIFLGRLKRSTQGLGALEFAMTAPFLILLYLGSYQLMDAISAYRKVTITARALADLSTQNDTLTPSQMQQILNGSRQIMTPYSTTGASLVTAQIAVDKNGNATFTWVCAQSQSPVCAQTMPGQLKMTDVNLPANLKIPNSYTVYNQIAFRYTPPFVSSLVGPLTFRDHIFMNPRRSPSVCLNTSSSSTPSCMGQ